MRVFFDLNVLLDVELDRPTKQASLDAISACDRDGFERFVAWHSLATAFYIANRALDRQRAEDFLADILAMMTVAAVSHSDAINALGFQMKDFEDAMQLAAALAYRADVIVTRNDKDFPRNQGIGIQTPEEFISSVT